MEDDQEYPITPMRSNVLNRPVENNPPLEEPRTEQDLVDDNEDPNVDHLERTGFPIRDLLTGRKRMQRFRTFDGLSIMTRQIHYFVESGRENWTYDKAEYVRAEKNFALSVYKIVLTAEKNCIIRLGVYPPMEREDFRRLEYCFDFEPFRKHLTKRQVKDMANSMENMREYYKEYVAFSDKVIRDMNHLEKRLKVQVKV